MRLDIVILAVVHAVLKLPTAGATARVAVGACLILRAWVTHMVLP